MTTLYDDHDRAKASEHAIFLWRELRVAAEEIARVLPRIAGRLGDDLSLIVPAPASTKLPLELVIDPSRESTDWWIELRLPTRDGVRDFFEGCIRLESLAPQNTRVMLRGRFTFPREELQIHLDQNAMHDIAEDNVIRIFEHILHEIEIAAGTRR